MKQKAQVYKNKKLIYFLGGEVMNLKKLRTRFIELYGEGEHMTFFSPSRINIIGEHIDYNGGKVLPAAIEIGTYGIVRKRQDNTLRLASENRGYIFHGDINHLHYNKEDDWTNYPKGVVYTLKEAGYKVGGMDILVEGNIPNGAGLSSSASLELLIAVMVNHLFNEDKIDRIELAKLSQKAENDFVGVKCGIMDQFAIGMGKKNKAILLDTETIEYEYINMDLKDNIIVIMNTNKRRELSDSKYNQRRRECEEALSIINEFTDLDNLCQLSINDFQILKPFIKCENIRNITEHVVYENYRVGKASKALKDGDIEAIGKLLIESHESLRDLYQVTGIELDTIVNIANEHSDCLGARMTGAGFGGCAIAIVKKNRIENFINHVGKEYLKTMGYDADFLITGIGNGTSKI